VTPPRQGRPRRAHEDARYYVVPARRRAWLAVLGWFTWGLAGLIVAVVVGGYVFLDDTLSAAAPKTEAGKKALLQLEPVKRGDPINVLLIGSDIRPQAGDATDRSNSDSLILLRVDTRRGSISMLSFPRDLYVDIPGMGRNRINVAFSAGGAELTMKTIKQLTGEDINQFVILDFQGFERLVDKVGGVYIDVDRRYFNDNAGRGPTSSYEAIDLQAGYQRLNGPDALDYVRYRHTDDDFARIARQQRFLSEVKRQTKKLGNLRSLTDLRDIFVDNIVTSIDNPRDFISLLNAALSTEDDQIARISIKGTPTTLGSGASVVMADATDIANAVQAWRDPTFEGDPAEKAPDPSTVDVAVLNGSGRPFDGQKMVDALRAKRYAARVAGNADSFGYASSAVYYAPDFRPSARRIAAMLGPGATTAPLSEAESKNAEVVVITGADFTGQLLPPPPPAPEPPAKTVDTLSLKPILGQVQRAIRMPVLVPLKVATGSEARIVRAYHIQAGKKRYPAVKIVFRVQNGYLPDYWGFQMTTMPDPPILEGETGRFTSGGREYRTYYDGKNLMRLAWQIGGATYWISNSLDNALSARTIQEIAKSTRPLGRAKLPKGRTPTEIPVDMELPTP
jgi:LCP family protein required for cell wall assembly